MSVDAEGNSYFTEKTVALAPGTCAGIGALSELMPTTGEDVHHLITSSEFSLVLSSDRID